MSKQILLCVETNKKARTDYLYIVATIKKYYIDDRKIIQRPIFLDSKTKYNAKDKVKEINKAIKEFSGETKVIYFIDVDDIIHFLRREMLDFTAFPVFFVSNLLLVQRKKYYFNRAMVSRNCSIVL